MGLLKDGKKNEFGSLRKSTAGLDHYEAFFKKRERGGKWSISKNVDVVDENVKWSFS